MAADPHSLVAPYALHALDDEEGRTFEEHLAVCERCREELAGLREAASKLAYGAAGPTPPPELKERILAQARSERENVASLPGSPAQLDRAARGRGWIAAAVAIGLGVWTATRPSESSALAKVLAQPGATLMPMGDRGAVAVAPNGEAALAVRVPPARAARRTRHGSSAAARPLRPEPFREATARRTSRSRGTFPAARSSRSRSSGPAGSTVRRRSLSQPPGPCRDRSPDHPAAGRVVA